MVTTAARDIVGTEATSASGAVIPAAADLPVVLTARPLLRARPDLAPALVAAGLTVRAVASWERLPEGAERIQPAVVLIDMDAADLGGKEQRSLSGHRIVTLLARRLPNWHIALVVLTALDFAEIEDLARAGISALVPPDVSAKVLAGHLRAALARHNLRHHHRRDAAPRTVAAPLAGGSPPRRLARVRPLAPTDGWRLPEPLWRELAGVLPCDGRRVRTRIPDRQIVEAMLYVLRTGDPLSALPRAFGSPQTVRRRLRAWREAGVLDRLRAAAMRERSYLRLLDWDRLAGTRTPTVSSVSPVSPLTAQTARTRSGR